MAPLTYRSRVGISRQGRTCDGAPDSAAMAQQAQQAVFLDP